MSAAKTKVSSGLQRKKRVQFLQKPNCTTCRKAKKFMESKGFQLDLRDLGKDRLSAAEIEKLVGDRDYTQFLNSRNELYRRMNMREQPPSREEAIRLMAQEPNLIRRPVIRAGGRIVLGFDEKGIAKLYRDFADETL
ncbi:MAG TPA: Spx/MgsR family RNA polymerase-binding regulatory protein [Candidatus Acidoferrales bacterium]|nr:Spx/MgsR family RNA polymerase-binding regulatory protein [Candidatus Acidoferrales bacterium]